MSKPFEGQVAVITGGARGLGEACARALVAQGADVVLADINAEQLRDSAQQISETYPQCRVRTFALDVRRQAECFAMADYVVSELGRFDIAVHAAGIASPHPSLDVTEDDWNRLIAINMNGVFFCCQAAGRAMQSSGRGGVIVNISSIAAQTGWPARTSYAAAKAGVMLITQSLAVEWASLGIRVNAVDAYQTATCTAALLKKRRNRSVVQTFRARLGMRLAIRLKCTLRPLYSPSMSSIKFVSRLSHESGINGSTRVCKILYSLGMAIERIVPRFGFVS